MRSEFSIALAGLGILAAPLPAAARNVVADPEIIAEVMKDAGYRAEIERMNNGGRFIQSASSGYPFRIFFFGCEDDFTDCKTIQLFAGFVTDTSPSLKAMNAHARDNRFGRIYIDDEDDPVIEMDIDLEDGGMSPELFKDNLEYWDYYLGRFAAFVTDRN
jgi:hypothetical protein